MENKLKISRSTVILCPTEELAKKVIKVFIAANLKWNSGKNYCLTNTKWNEYRIKSTYDPYGGLFGSVESCLDQGRNIMAAEDFLNLHPLIETKVPFDVEKAKAGAEVTTRSGCPVRILCYDKKNEKYPIVALTECKNDNREVCRSFTFKGREYGANESDYDLMLIQYEILNKAVEMTVAQIEEKLGISNLKIVK